jgi:hypothetical protein
LQPGAAPATALSVGKAQSIKLATELQRPQRDHSLYIRDEPTRGLSPGALLKSLAQMSSDQDNRLPCDVVKWFRMISANVIKGVHEKGVHELLEERGIRPEPDETFGDMVARALDISGRQSEILLESLHDGASVDEAVAAAEIDPSHLEGDLLVRIARAIGTALGRVNRS